MQHLERPHPITCLLSQQLPHCHVTATRARRDGAGELPYFRVTLVTVMVVDRRPVAPWAARPHVAPPAVRLVAGAGSAVCRRGVQMV
jgi:hypothetical protein